MPPIVAHPRVNVTLSVFPSGRTVLRRTRGHVSTGKRDKSDKMVSIIAQSERERVSAAASSHEKAEGLTWPKENFVTARLPGRGVMAPKCPGFSPRRGSQVKDFCSALQVKYGKDVLMVSTFTLPGSTRSAKMALAAWSSEVTRRHHQFVNRKWSLPDGKHQNVFVWELQGRGALHCHILTVLPSAESADDFKKASTAWWFDMLVELSDKAGTDLFAKTRSYSHRNSWESISKVAADFALVDKDVAAYFSKYISKGFGRQKTVGVSYWSRTIWPSSWSGRSDDTYELCEELTIRRRLGKMDVSAFVELKEEWSRWLTAEEIWQRPVMNPYTREDCGVVAVSERAKMLVLQETFSGVVNSMNGKQEEGLFSEDKESAKYWSGIYGRIKEFELLEESERCYYKYCNGGVGDLLQAFQFGSNSREHAINYLLAGLAEPEVYGFRQVPTDPFDENTSLEYFDEKKMTNWEP